MRKIILIVLLLFMLFSFSACDRNYNYYVQVVSTDEVFLYYIDEEDAKNELLDEKSLFNSYFGTEYKDINFDDLQNNNTRWYVGCFTFKFETSNDIIDLKMELIDADKYLLDFIRVGVIFKDEIYIYKFYDKKEQMYDKENDPLSILHFENSSLITDSLNFDVIKDEFNELSIIYWIEEGEGVTPNGDLDKNYSKQRYKMGDMNLKISISRDSKK